MFSLLYFYVCLHPIDNGRNGILVVVGNNARSKFHLWWECWMLREKNPMRFWCRRCLFPQIVTGFALSSFWISIDFAEILKISFFVLKYWPREAQLFMIFAQRELSRHDRRHHHCFWLVQGIQTKKKWNSWMCIWIIWYIYLFIILKLDYQMENVLFIAV